MGGKFTEASTECQKPILKRWVFNLSIKSAMSETVCANVFDDAINGT